MIQKNNKKILRFLIRNFEPININQLSRNLKISIGSVFKILNSLEDKKIVSHNSLGNAKYYKINLNNTEAFALSELLLLEERREIKGYSRIYAEEISKFNKAELIILFGSVLENKSFNDVDVLFVTNRTKEVTKFCLEISKLKTKPVVPLILSKKDLVEKLKKGDNLIINIFKLGVVLSGEKSYLEVIKNVER